MHTLKHNLVLPPTFVSINYSEEAGSIIFAVDASLEGWGATLMQLIDGKRHLARYKSEI